MSRANCAPAAGSRQAAGSPAPNSTAAASAAADSTDGSAGGGEEQQILQQAAIAAAADQQPPAKAGDMAPKTLQQARAEMLERQEAAKARHVSLVTSYVSLFAPLYVWSVTARQQEKAAQGSWTLRGNGCSLSFALVHRPLATGGAASGGGKVVTDGSGLQAGGKVD